MPVAIAKMFGSKMMSSGGKPTLSDEDVVGARGRSRVLRSQRVGLPLLVERHHHDGGAMAAHDRAWRMNSSSPSLSEIELTIALP